MPTTTQAEKAKAFAALHAAPGTFVIPNPWDGASAKMLAAFGFQALATSSGAQAGALGRRDGHVTRDEALAHCKLIVDAVDLPVSADLEAGFGATTSDVADTYRMAADIGLVGATIEDATGDPANPLFSFEEAVARVSAAVEAVRSLPFPFLVAARAHGLFFPGGELDDVISRLKAFEAVGADVLFAPGLPDIDAVRRVCQSVSKPVNFMVAIPGRYFSVAELADAGVKRISLATSLYKAAVTGFVAAIKEVQEHGTFTYIDRSIPTREFNGYLD